MAYASIAHVASGNLLSLPIGHLAFKPRHATAAQANGLGKFAGFHFVIKGATREPGTALYIGATKKGFSHIQLHMCFRLEQFGMERNRRQKLVWV